MERSGRWDRLSLICAGTSRAGIPGGSLVEYPVGGDVIRVCLAPLPDPQPHLVTVVVTEGAEHCAGSHAGQAATDRWPHREAFRSAADALYGE